MTAGKGLLDESVLTARFHPGKTAIGHRWDLLDGEGQQVGRTHRVHSGGAAGRLFWNTVTVTGMDAGNDIIADVLGADGAAVARLASRAGELRVDVTGPGGVPVGALRRVKGEALLLEQPGGQEAGRVPIAKDSKAPWRLLDARGATIGALTLVHAKPVPAVSLFTAVAFPDMFEPSRAYKQTMHMGFAHSREYGIVLDALPAGEPLRTLSVLLPVICGVAY